MIDEERSLEDFMMFLRSLNQTMRKNGHKGDITFKVVFKDGKIGKFKLETVVEKPKNLKLVRSD